MVSLKNWFRKKRIKNPMVTEEWEMGMELLANKRHLPCHEKRALKLLWLKYCQLKQHHAEEHEGYGRSDGQRGTV